VGYHATRFDIAENTFRRSAMRGPGGIRDSFPTILKLPVPEYLLRCESVDNTSGPEQCQPARNWPRIVIRPGGNRKGLHDQPANSLGITRNERGVKRHLPLSFL
jgi:hypothetical protein